MKTIQPHVPESLRQDIDRYFAGEDLAVVLAHLLEEAIEARKREAQLPERRAKAMDAILEFRNSTRPVSTEEILRLRQELRE